MGLRGVGFLSCFPSHSPCTVSVLSSAKPTHLGKSRHLGEDESRLRGLTGVPWCNSTDGSRPLLSVGQPNFFYKLIESASRACTSLLDFSLLFLVCGAGQPLLISIVVKILLFGHRLTSSNYFNHRSYPLDPSPVVVRRDLCHRRETSLLELVPGTRPNPPIPHIDRWGVGCSKDRDPDDL